MIRRMILWKLRTEYDEIKKEEIRREIKTGLESLVGVIPGLLEMRVQTGGLASSTADLMLDSTFESKEALDRYKDHPAHVAVADGSVRPHVETRLCLDFE